MVIRSVLLLSGVLKAGLKRVEACFWVTSLPLIKHPVSHHAFPVMLRHLCLLVMLTFREVAFFGDDTLQVLLKSLPPPCPRLLRASSEIEAKSVSELAQHATPGSFEVTVSPRLLLSFQK